MSFCACSYSITIGNNSTGDDDDDDNNDDDLKCPELIRTYEDLQNSCKCMGYDFVTADTDLGAGQQDVTVTGRSNLVELNSGTTTPYSIDRNDTEYRLTGNITAANTAFRIVASRVTLNLNGYTINYGTQNSSDSDSYGVDVDAGDLADISIVNGDIIQGGGSCQGGIYGNGCNPVNLSPGPSSSEVGGINMVWSTPDTSGIWAYSTRNMHIHHNRFEDNGSWVTDRHQMVPTINALDGGYNNTHHNLVVNARQTGLRMGRIGSEIHYNEVHINCWHTNSTAITLGTGKVHHNKVFAKGYLPVGIWVGDDSDVYSNFVDVHRTRKQHADMGNEYENPHGTAMRMTYWSVQDGYHDIIMTCNHFEFTGGERIEDTSFYSRGRALWLGLIDEDYYVLYDHNYIRGSNKDGSSKAQAIGIVNASAGTIEFRNNIISSNYSNVTLGDDYGGAQGNHLFINNHFIKEDNHPTYNTIQSHYSSRVSMAKFFDSSFEGGASFEADNIDLELWGSGHKEVEIGHTESATLITDHILTNSTSIRDSGSSWEPFEDGFKVFP